MPSLPSSWVLLTLSNLQLAIQASKSMFTLMRGTTAHWPAEFGVEIMAALVVLWWRGGCLAVEEILVVFDRRILLTL